MTRLKSTFFSGHMIHQIGLESPQDHEYAIQKNLSPLVLDLLPKTVIRLGLTRLGEVSKVRLG